HFNILTFNKSYQDFSTVYENHKHVTESFENSEIKGVRISIYKNLIDKSLQKVSRCAEFAYEHSGAIALFLLGVSSILNINQTSEFTINLTTIFDVVVIVLYFIIFLSKSFSKKTRANKTHLSLNSKSISNACESNQFSNNLIK